MFNGGENVNGASESMEIHIRWPLSINPSMFEVTVIRNRKKPGKSLILIAGKQNYG